MEPSPRAHRLAAYAVIVRDHRILMCRLSSRVADREIWALPGGGVEHGEHPREAVVREVYEETGLHAVVGETARVHSWHHPSFDRDDQTWDYHSVRLVYDGSVPLDSPEPQVMEVDGTTAEAAWLPLADVLGGKIPLSAVAREELLHYEPVQVQRLTANAFVRRGEEILLVRISERGAHPGQWTLPGGGVEHGEAPRDAVVRELSEECGLAGEVSELIVEDDVQFHGTAPTGRHEDYHGVHLVYAVTVANDAQPQVMEVDGTTDAVAWIPVARLGDYDVAELVQTALDSQ